MNIESENPFKESKKSQIKLKKVDVIYKGYFSKELKCQIYQCSLPPYAIGTSSEKPYKHLQNKHKKEFQYFLEGKTYQQFLEENAKELDYKQKMASKEKKFSTKKFAQKTQKTLDDKYQKVEKKKITDFRESAAKCFACLSMPKE
jgi:hypothetical protein